MSWWREGSLRELTVGHQVASQRYSIDKSDPRSWTLVIRNVTQSDAGNYICQINLSKLKEKFYRLSVLRTFTENQALETTKQDSTKLNDEYVKDEATPYKNMSHQEANNVFWTQASSDICFAMQKLRLVKQKLI
ncbi:defective proboscis extension response (dpr)-related [Clonorchis sinensis]|uniref:Defective proboscis extension response (Dpr)-related n=2 Tax=Clonorchis sinensis TaxID=79923 RepID=G7Y3V1_CLOSI|nr:defective proboscis extension response (dpr)-related [Clonorchis sinensis]